MRHYIKIAIDVTTKHKDAREELLRDSVGTVLQLCDADMTFSAALVTVEREINDEKVPR